MYFQKLIFFQELTILQSKHNFYLPSTVIDKHVIHSVLYIITCRVTTSGVIVWSKKNMAGLVHSPIVLSTNYTHLTIPGFVLDEKLQRNDLKFAIFLEYDNPNTVIPCTTFFCVPKKTHLVQNYTVQGTILLYTDLKNFKIYTIARTTLIKVHCARSLFQTKWSENT